MIGNQGSRIKSKQQIKKLIALVCVVGFVLMIIMSAFHFTDHTSNSTKIGQRLNSCHRTQMPECRCNVGITQMRFQFKTHIHNDSHIDCFICVIIQKTVELTRQTGVAEIPTLDLGLLILAGVGFMFILAGSTTPVKLKTRTNN